MKQEDFKIGQKVKTYDAEDEKLVEGKVTGIESDRVFIKWEDLKEEATHHEDEWPLIFPAKY